ncbi:MAG TPA: presqualene diphosphate synthase HpnD [Aliidongia sp.]|nr:presqualene diphosphate synthase HpnD [Aliidongia sp.]
MSAVPALAEDFEADLAEAVRRAGAAKSSFYTAMRLLPEARRNAMFAVYAFCREVDDIADEPPAPGTTKSAELDLWRAEIETIYEGGIPSKSLARALIGPVRNFGLLKSDFLAIVDGMQMDADRDIRAPGRAELELYCARVAGAVGRLSVRIFGTWKPRADDVADHLGLALQLTNILRDVDEDAERGRLYLPRETLAAHGIMTDDPAAVLAHPKLGAVCAEVAAWALAEFEAAERAMAECERAAMRPAMMMGGVYKATIQHLMRRGWAPPRPPVKLSKLLKLWIALRRGYL